MQTMVWLSVGIFMNMEEIDAFVFGWFIPARDWCF